MLKLTIIGLLNKKPNFNAELLSLIHRHHYFAGGARMQALVQSFLPKSARWVTIGGDLNLFLQQLEPTHSPTVLFASGDPWFFGIAGSLKKLRPDIELEVLPTFNCIQRLCHKQQLNYSACQHVSAHGRSLATLDQALIKNHKFISVLTDSKNTPQKIARHMLDFGFDHYTMLWAKNLDAADENIQQLTLAQASQLEYSGLECIILQQQPEKTCSFGIADHQFKRLRPNLITKLPIRLALLHALDLEPAKCLWDIGACSGAVSIEAKRHFPQLTIVAIEKRSECLSLMQHNMHNLSAPGIDIQLENFFNLNLQSLPIPDRVFIGGHGQQLKTMLHKLHEYLVSLKPAQVNIKIVFNAVQTKSKDIFTECLTNLGYQLQTPLELKVNQQQPVFILTAQQPRTYAS